MSMSTLPEDVAADLLALPPPDAQYAAAQFIAFLCRGQPTSITANESAVTAKRQKPRKARVPFREEPSFGMWRDRPEMADCVEYVRNCASGSSVILMRDALLVDTDICIDVTRGYAPTADSLVAGTTLVHNILRPTKNTRDFRFTQ